MHLVRQVATRAEARAVARMALLNQRASQAPYIDTSMMPRPAEGFSAGVQRWLAERLAEPFDLGVLAAAFHISGRTLLRRLKVTGLRRFGCPVSVEYAQKLIPLLFNAATGS